MRRKRIAVWAALGLLVAALSVVAAGCGGGSDSADADRHPRGRDRGVGSELLDRRAEREQHGREAQHRAREKHQ
jgi:hypothetical protein